MADKKNTIQLGENTLELPAWASESTLAALANQSANAVKLTSSLMSTVQKNKDVDDEIIEAVKTNTQIGINNAQVNQTEAKHRTSILLKGAEAVRDTAGFFGDSEKPLSSMVAVTEKVVNKLKGSNGKLNDATAEMTPFQSQLKGTLKQIGGVAVDIGLAWAGWNAAKFEQFAEVQKSMIDSGAVVFDTADAFNELYTDAFQSGITYKTFADVVSNFGGTLVALGGDTSRGSQSLMSLFKRLETNVDELGDLGLTNKELLNTYAGYIETQRLTGQLDRQLVNQGEDLENSFKQLVMESGAVANLTALTRSEAMGKMLGALSDTQLAAGMAKLEDKGLENTAEVVEELTKQISLMTGIGPSDLVDTLQVALNQGVSQFSGDMSKFDIRMIIGTLNQDAVGVLEHITPGLIDEINRLVIDAEKNNGEISKTFIIDALAKADLEKKAFSAADGPLKAAQNLQDSIYLIMQNLGGLEGAELVKEAEKLRQATAESGTATKAINDMSKAFLTAQEFITLPMQSFGESLEFTTGLLGDGAGWLADLFKGYKDEETVEITEGDTVSDRAAEKDGLSLNTNTNASTESHNTENSAPTSTVVDDAMGNTGLNTGQYANLEASIMALSLPELQDRLTNLENRATINNTLGSYSVDPALIKAMEERVKVETELVQKQIKNLEEQNRIKENTHMNEQYNLAAGLHQ